MSPSGARRRSPSTICAAAGFDALVFAIGAQGTKYLGIEGERLPGVYHAKDLVYHYNRLPPFSAQPFPIGRRVAIVGVGNVMVDIANYCVHFCDSDEVIAIARRGPYEKAYDDREFEDIEDALRPRPLPEEIARIRPRLEAAGQDADGCCARSASGPRRTAPARPPALPLPRLAAPRARGGRARGRARGGGDAARAASGDRDQRGGHRRGERRPCDPVVFAVGDRVDPRRGPALRGRHVRDRARREDPRRAYQVWDPATGAAMPGVFVVGWARRASDGVVGRARLDAETG